MLCKGDHGGNKVRYTAAKVACKWAGAVMKKMNQAIWDWAVAVKREKGKGKVSEDQNSKSGYVTDEIRK